MEQLKHLAFAPYLLQLALGLCNGRRELGQVRGNSETHVYSFRFQQVLRLKQADEQLSSRAVCLTSCLPHGLPHELPYELSTLRAVCLIDCLTRCFMSYLTRYLPYKLPYKLHYKLILASLNTLPTITSFYAL